MDLATVTRLLDGDDVRRRAIRLTGELLQEAIEQAMVKLFHLQETDGLKPVTLEIDSPGGCAYSLFGIINMMDSRQGGVAAKVRRWLRGWRQVPPTPIGTVCLGRAHGTAAVILAHGDRGSRAAVRTASIEFSPLWFSGEADEGVRAEIARLEERMVASVARDSGLPAAQVRGFFADRAVFDAETARFLNLIDRIVD